MGLKYAFHDAESSRLVLVIDLMMGGDLKYWLSQHKCFGFEASRYYGRVSVPDARRGALGRPQEEEEEKEGYGGPCLT